MNGAAMRRPAGATRRRVPATTSSMARRGGLGLSWRILSSGRRMLWPLFRKNHPGLMPLLRITLEERVGERRPRPGRARPHGLPPVLRRDQGRRQRPHLHGARLQRGRQLHRRMRRIRAHVEDLCRDVTRADGGRDLRRSVGVRGVYGEAGFQRRVEELQGRRLSIP